MSSAGGSGAGCAGGRPIVERKIELKRFFLTTKLLSTCFRPLLLLGFCRGRLGSTKTEPLAVSLPLRGGWVGRTPGCRSAPAGGRVSTILRALLRAAHLPCRMGRRLSRFLWAARPCRRRWRLRLSCPAAVGARRIIRGSRLLPRGGRARRLASGGSIRLWRLLRGTRTGRRRGLAGHRGLTRRRGRGICIPARLLRFPLFFSADFLQNIIYIIVWRHIKQFPPSNWNLPVCAGG